MTEGTFSVSLNLRDVPAVVVGIDGGVWLDLCTFTREDKDLGLSTMTVHLPDSPGQVRELARQLLAAAEKLETLIVQRAEEKLA